MTDASDKPLWTPSPERVAQTNVVRFMEAVEDDWNVNIRDFAELYQFSVDELEKYWQSMKDDAGIIAETWGDVVLENPDQMPGATWFPGARLNYAENLLRRRDDADAIVFWGEDKVRSRMSFAELYDQVSRFSQALRAMGIKPGDRVVAYLPNLAETIVAVLAAASIGEV